MGALLGGLGAVDPVALRMLWPGPAPLHRFERAQDRRWSRPAALLGSVSENRHHPHHRERSVASDNEGSGTNGTEYRIEHDSMGEVRVPGWAKWRAPPPPGRGEFPPPRPPPRRR